MSHDCSAGSSALSASTTSMRGAIRRIIETAFRRGVWHGYGTPTRVPGASAASSATTSMNSGDGSMLTTGTSLTERAHLLGMVRRGDDGVDAARARRSSTSTMTAPSTLLDAVAERCAELRDERLRLVAAALDEQQPAGADGGALGGARERTGCELVRFDALARGFVERAVEDRLERVVVGARQRVGDDGADLAPCDDPALVLQPRVDGADRVGVHAQRGRHLTHGREPLAGLVLAGRDGVPQLPEQLRPERYGQV